MHRVIQFRHVILTYQGELRASQYLAHFLLSVSLHHLCLSQI